MGRGEHLGGKGKIALLPAVRTPGPVQRTGVAHRTAGVRRAGHGGRAAPGPARAAGGRFFGGNQQKLVLGRWINEARHVDVLLDELPQGVDVGARQASTGWCPDSPPSGAPPCCSRPATPRRSWRSPTAASSSPGDGSSANSPAPDSPNGPCSGSAWIGGARIAGIAAPVVIAALVLAAGALFPAERGTAVLVGGVALTGGSGSILGVLLGVLFLGSLQNGLTLLHVPTFWQQMARGAALVAGAALAYFAPRTAR